MNRLAAFFRVLTAFSVIIAGEAIGGADVSSILDGSPAPNSHRGASEDPNGRQSLQNRSKEELVTSKKRRSKTSQASSNSKGTPISLAAARKRARAGSVDSAC
jgi:hypothetical protein